MATQRWLNIVVDGNAALRPYWPKIVSDYLQKIVRCFCDNSREQGANAVTCELGLIMYNANSDLGCEVQFIYWTRDVDYFLGSLSCLAFNGDDFNQYAMAEGLAEALVMYPRPCNGSTPTQDYYNRERHCILVATGDPVPRKMLVTVPMVREGKLVGTPLETFKADFLEVAQMFSPLAVSLSVITPKQHEIFGKIFNLGNTITEMACPPLSNYEIGRFIVLLSRNFKEAREALHEKRIEYSSKKRSVESMRTNDITLTELFTNGLQEGLFAASKTTTIGEQAIEDLSKKRSVESMKTTDLLTELFTSGLQEDLFSAGKTMLVREQAIEAAKAELRTVTSIESQLLVVPNATTNETHVSSSYSLSPVNVHEGIIAQLNADIDIVLPSKKPKTSLALAEDPLTGLFLPAQLPFDDVQDSCGQQQRNSTKKNINMEALIAVETEFEKALQGGSVHVTSKNQTCFIDLTKESSKDVQISPVVVSKVPSTTTTTTGIRSSKRLLLEPKGNMGVLDFSLGNSSSSTFLPHQNSSSLWPTTPQPWYGGVQCGKMSTTIRLGMYDPMEPENQARNRFGNSMFPHATSNSVIQFQPYTSTRLQVYPDVSSSQYGGGSRGIFSSELLREHHYPGYQYQRDRMTTANGPLHIPVVGRSTTWVPPVPRFPQVTHPGSLLLPASIMDFEDYVHTWEGCLGGKIQSSNMSHIRAKGFRRATSPFTLTFQWTGRLEISHFIPLRAVNHTQSIIRGHIDYVIFHLIHYENLDLYEYLMSQNLCAKIDLPYQTLILSPTESAVFYIGTVFPGETMFLEPV